MSNEVFIPCIEFVKRYRGNLPGFTTLYPFDYRPRDRKQAADFFTQHCQNCPARIQSGTLKRMENYEPGVCTGYTSGSGGEIRTSK